MFGALAVAAAGLVAIVWGAEWLVRASARLAIARGWSPMVVGLTLVAFGTSAPELGVTTLAAVDGRADLAVGNIAGSNVFNLLVVVGAAALVAPLNASRRLVLAESTLVLVASVAVAWLAADGVLAGTESLAMLAALALWLLRSRGAGGELDRAHLPTGSDVREALRLTASVVLLAAGSHALVAAAVDLAERTGTSELAVGALLLGAGTSLPELVTSIVAAARGQREIALGNALGSSVFNLLAVLGLAGLLAPGGLHVSARALAFELPAAALAVPLCALALLSRSRGGALALLGCYAIYVAATVGGAAAWAAP